MSITRGEIKERVEAQKLMGGLELDTSKLYKWLNDLENRVHEVRIAISPLRYTSTSTYSVSNSTSTQALPSDLKSLDGKDLGVWVLDDDSNRSYQLPITSIDSDETGYVIVEDDFVFTGFGDDVQSVKVWYLAEYAPKTTWVTSDTLNFPTEDEAFYAELAVNWVNYRFFKDEEDFVEEAKAFAEYEAMLLEMETKMNRNPNSLIFASNYGVY